MIFVWILLLILAFYLLDKICDDYFIATLDRIAQKFKLSPEASATTFMAIGSSSPELAISLIALFKPGGHELLGMGTIIGSALFNLLFVVGVSAIIAAKTKLLSHAILRDLLYYLFSVGLLFFFFSDGAILLWEALVFVLLYFFYVVLILFWKKFFPESFKDVLVQEEGELVLSWRRMRHWSEQKFQHTFFVSHWEKPILVFEKFTDRVIAFIFPNHKFFWRTFFVSLLFIISCSWIIVESAASIAELLGISQVIIGLTVLAIGASFPDFLASLIVAKEGRGNMAISNPIASDSFDLLFGLGFPWLLFLLFFGNRVPVEKSDLLGSVLLLFGSGLLVLFLFILKRFEIGKIVGWILVGTYLLYLVWMVMKTFFPSINFLTSAL